MNENKELYLRILRNACIFLIIMTLLVYFITNNVRYMLAVVIGGVMSMLGFGSIIGQSHFLGEGSTSKFVIAYLIRYILYFIVMYIAMAHGFHVICILIGFLSISISIKINEFYESVKRKEE